MHWFIWWIRSCFCDHKWEYAEVDIKKRKDGNSEWMRKNVFVSATCKNCGWHRKYKKFLDAKY